MKKIQATDILNLNVSKEEKLELLKLWLTTDMNMWIEPKNDPKPKWWQFWKR